MEYIIGVILVIIVSIIIVLLFRKRLYDQVDYYEGWKVDIIGRNVAGKLTRIKTLGSEGEAKAKLENWKKDWDKILTNDLADVEELLFDAEHAADRFRIGKARKYIISLEETLVNIERKIDQIETEIERLIDTDKTNREEMERVEPRVKELRKRLVNNRNEYDRAVERFETDLDEILDDIQIYNELVSAGTYSEASEIVEKVSREMAEMERKMEVFPALYKQCKVDLPNKLDDVYKNIQEMESQGYYLEHLQLKKSINDLQARLLDYLAVLEKTDTEKVEKFIPEMEEQIEEMYDLLEQEVMAKNFVDSKSVTFSQSLERLLKEFAETKEEVTQLKKTYHFEDKDLEKYMSLEKRINELSKRHEIFKSKVTERQDANSILRNDLTANLNEFESLDDEHTHYKKEIANLRKDEISAREQIDWMTEELSKAQRKLRLSNLPGIPNYIISLLEDATEKNDRVLNVIEKQPLDITQLQKTLEEAKGTVENALEQTNKMIEHAELTEVAIQYGNRYRSRDPILAAKLLEAEESFRKANYEIALEQASEAISERDPHALERIEEIYNHGIA